MIDRRAALAMLAATPGLAMAGNRSISVKDLGFSDGLTYDPPRIACRFTPDGWIEIPLDNWCGWRVMLGGESVAITPADLFAALKGPSAAPHEHNWHPGPFYLPVASSYEEPRYYAPAGLIRLECCDCGLLRLPDGLGMERGENLARRTP